MSIATALLIIGALSIVLVMHFVGHGGRGANDQHGAGEAEAASTADQGEAAGVRKSHGGHGCC